MTRKSTHKFRNALIAGCVAVGSMTVVTPQASASEIGDLLPEGSSISAPFNQGSAAISPFNEFLSNILRTFWASVGSPIPGPFMGSSGMGSSDHVLDFNLRR